MISIQYSTQLLPNPNAVTLTAVWGARAIDEGRNGFSLVGNRQDSAHVDNPAGLEAIGKAINANLAKMSKRFVIACDNDLLSSRTHSRACLWKDDEVTVIATCSASYGYVYLLAFLTAEWPNATGLTPIVNDPPPPKKVRKPAKTKPLSSSWYRNAY